MIEEDGRDRLVVGLLITIVVLAVYIAIMVSISATYAEKSYKQAWQAEAETNSIVQSLVNGDYKAGH